MERRKKPMPFRGDLEKMSNYQKIWDTDLAKVYITFSDTFTSHFLQENDRLKLLLRKLVSFLFVWNCFFFLIEVSSLKFIQEKTIFIFFLYPVLSLRVSDQGNALVHLKLVCIKGCAVKYLRIKVLILCNSVAILSFLKNNVKKFFFNYERPYQYFLSYLQEGVVGQCI